MPIATTVEVYRHLTRLAAIHAKRRVKIGKPTRNDIRIVPILFPDLKALPVPTDWAFGEKDPETEKRPVIVNPAILKTMFRSIADGDTVLFELKTAEEF